MKRLLDQRDTATPHTPGGRTRLLCLCGFLSPAVAFAAIGLAIALSPWFSWRRNALSDLGALSSPVWPIFNTGLVLSGLLALVFTCVLLEEARARGRLATAGAFLLWLGSLSLSLIGILPEDVGFAHFLVSLIFFVLTPLGLLALGSSRLLPRGEGGPREGLHRGLVVLVLGLLALATWILWGLFRPELGISVPEIMAAVFISAAMILLALDVLKGHF